MKQRIYIALGVLNVGLGIAGVFLPLLPTTPFVLLAAFLFARSSPRWHDWLMNHPRLGPYIHAFRDRSGLTMARKIRIGASFTTVMAISFYFSPMPTIRAMLAGMWLFWLVMLMRLRTLPPEEAPATNANDPIE